MEEARALTGKDTPREALLALAPRFPVVALKLGAEGGMLSIEGKFSALPAPKVRVIDTTGAGDAFNAGLLDAWLNGEVAEDCLEAAIAAGTRSVQAPGGATTVASA
jgi:sugar/nucleoside kinase (ribokinase family)